MKNTHIVSGLLAAVLLPFSLHASAQAASISDCQAIQDRLARYACYDSWDAASGTVRRTAPARSSSAARVQQQEEDEGSLLGRIFDGDSDEAQTEESPQVATEASPESELENFGRREAGNSRIVGGENGEAELVDTVVSLEQAGPSMWLITLSGGQQWKQMLSKRYPLVEGDEIRVYSTRWGNAFRLASSRLGGYIQVERVDAGGASAPVARANTAPSAPVQQEEEEEAGFFGRIFDRDSDEEAPEEEPEESTQVATAASPEAELENFGRTETTTRIVDGLDGKSELIDTIAGLEQAGPSMWRITLQGGQQWQQMLSKRYSLEEGDEIRIYPTRWGNAFRLSSRRLGGYIQVERVD